MLFILHRIVCLRHTHRFFCSFYFLDLCSFRALPVYDYRTQKVLDPNSVPKLDISSCPVVDLNTHGVPAVRLPIPVRAARSGTGENIWMILAPTLKV